MYIADNHVSDMLWNMKEHSVTPGGVMEYHIPNGLGNNGGTIIVGEWVEYTKKDGEQNMFFLVHSWDNEEAII